MSHKSHFHRIDRHPSFLYVYVSNLRLAAKGGMKALLAFCIHMRCNLSSIWKSDLAGWRRSGNDSVRLNHYLSWTGVSWTLLRAERLIFHTHTHTHTHWTAKMLTEEEDVHTHDMKMTCGEFTHKHMDTKKGQTGRLHTHKHTHAHTHEGTAIHSLYKACREHTHWRRCK